MFFNHRYFKGRPSLGGLTFASLRARKFRRPAKFGPPARRAISPSGDVWDACAAPLASPPKHPPRRFSITISWRGHASYAAGASLTRCAHSGDLPPRRVMPDSASALVKVRFSQNSNFLLRRSSPFDLPPRMTCPYKAFSAFHRRDQNG